MAVQGSVGQTNSCLVEDVILEVRLRLQQSSALGECGAAAIQRELVEHPRKYRLPSVPSWRTIGRILSRRGAPAAPAGPLRSQSHPR